MTRTIKLLPVLLVLILVTACGATPRAKMTQAYTAWEITITTIDTMHERELISDNELKDFKPWIEAGWASLEEADTYLPEGGTDFEARLNLVRAATRKLEEHFLAEPEP